MGKLIPFLFIALDGKSAVAHLRLRIPGHKLRGSWFSFRWSPVRIVIGSHGLIATVFYFKNYATGIQFVSLHSLFWKTAERESGSNSLMTTGKETREKEISLCPTP